MNKAFGICLFILFVSNTTYTDDETSMEIKPKMSMTNQLLLGEGLTSFNAWAFSQSPNKIGIIMAVLFPALGGIPNDSDTTGWASLIGVESMAFYNISIDENKDSDSEILKNNMVGWNLAMAAIGLSIYLTD